MAASPPALRRIMVWWRCNQDRSSVFPHTHTHAHAHAHARNRAHAHAHSRCSRVSVRRAGRVLQTYTHRASRSEAATRLAAFISEIHRVRFRARVFVSA